MFFCTNCAKKVILRRIRKNTFSISPLNHVDGRYYNYFDKRLNKPNTNS